MRTLARALATCALALPGLVGIAACGTENATARDPDDQPPSTKGAKLVTAEASSDEYGVRVRTFVGFDEDRVVTGAKLLWTGGSVDVSPYPLDGSDADVPPDPLRLPKGIQIQLEGSVLAACPDTPDVLVFEVESRVGDNKRIDRYRPEPSPDLERAFEEWCDLPVTMAVTGSMRTADGDYELYMTFTNPGPDVVTVVSEAVTLGAATWEESRVEVPPGTVTRMTVRGQGGDVCAAPAPWEGGHVLVDGHPITPISDEWC